MTKLIILSVLLWLSTASAAELPYTFETLDLAVPGQPLLIRVPVDINDQGRILTNIRTAEGIGQAVVTPAGGKTRIFRNQPWLFVSCNGPDTAGISLVDDMVVGLCVEGPTQALWKQFGFLKPLNGQLQLIDFPGADSTMATGRSADGKLVGNFAGPLNQNRGASAYRFHCWTLIAGQYRQIDYPAPNTAVSCEAINNKGQILMHYNTVTDQNETIEQGMVIYDNGSVTPLGLSFEHIGGPGLYFSDMNEDGAVIGLRWNTGPMQVFLWDDGLFFDIKFPEGWQVLSLGGMNNKEHFVGSYRIKTGAIDPVHGDPLYTQHGFLAVPAPVKPAPVKTIKEKGK